MTQWIFARNVGGNWVEIVKTHPPMPSSHQKLFDSITALDAVMAEKILYGDAVYEDVDKDYLIHQLADIFADFIAAGDTDLEQYEPQCQMKDCCLRTMDIRTFIGNNTLTYFDLTFMYSGDMRLKIQVDNYLCTRKMIDLARHIEEEKEYINFFEIHYEPYFGFFEKTTDTAIQQIETESALSPLGYNFIDDWCQKYQHLIYFLERKTMEDYPLQKEFMGIHKNLTVLNALKEKVDDALITYKLIMMDPNSKIQWLINYEVLILQVLNSDLPLFKSNIEPPQDYFPLSDKFPVPIRLMHYSTLFEFHKLIHPLYFEVFKRIKKVSDSECAAIQGAQGIEADVFHLSYHLNLKNK